MQSPSARGAATFYKYRARNLITKQKVDITLRGGDSLDEADFHRRPIKFMYADSDARLLPRPGELRAVRPAPRGPGRRGQVSDRGPGRHPGPDLQRPVRGHPVARGRGARGRAVRSGHQRRSATARTKPATLETGLVVQVPEYLNQGEKIKVDTRTGQFLSRA